MHTALVGLVLTILGVLWAVGFFLFGYGEGAIITVAPEKGDSIYG